MQDEVYTVEVRQNDKLLTGLGSYASEDVAFRKVWDYTTKHHQQEVIHETPTKLVITKGCFQYTSDEDYRFTQVKEIWSSYVERSY